ncbi:MAG: cupredoxin domain-containing protein, partial [Thermomicrobiales bacterium]|nr:cupredoxin domain-containing protein [Thermomicrobiales bacterium]
MKSLLAKVWIGAILSIALVLVVFGFAGPSGATAQSATPGGEASGGCPSATPAAGTATAAKPCVEIGMHDIYFQPNVATLPSDTAAQIDVVNHGQILHNFSITDHHNKDVPNLKISLNVEPGTTKSVDVNAKPDTYYFFCNIPGHEAAGMYGYLKVEAGAQPSTETAT